MDSKQKQLLEEIDERIEIDRWFPIQILDWIKHQSVRLGVPETYITHPLLISLSYLAQHSTAAYVLKHQFTQEDVVIHEEPLILYGLAVGQSGTCKTACLNLFSKCLVTRSLNFYIILYQN